MSDPFLKEMAEASKEIEQVEGGQKTNAIRILVISLLVMALAILLVTQDMAAIRGFIRTHGAAGLAVAVLIYGVLGATLVPSEPLTVLIAGIFGPLVAIFVATMGNILAATVEYYIGLKISDATSFETRRQHLPFGLGKLPVNSLGFLILGRITPGYGPKLVSLMAGMYHIPIWRYIWTTLIPTVLGSCILAFGGSGLFTLFKL